ncbi:branched-chain amino acid ABC transporter permease [Rhizobiaceae bacterium BDR2-2]|uniref:Branched-chain amino acid ABC transporter permease n=1 Tax=Ectorhizobium quercum TaxID=2965071 RepID=A0AAE3N0L2_9HYPH|nr:branched-chain amino acid ABC transporter permease [Ectorhizobium quercum]MCX8997110.1 branched-chain amino acid ABC transporter permease [Ectorhizobium quercum]
MRTTFFAIAGVAAIAVVGIAAPWLQFMLTLSVAKGFAALGVAVLLRAGLISIGHAMFFAIGAYVVAFLGRDAGVSDFILLLVSATVVSGLAGLVVGAFMVRYRAIFFAMLNLAVSMVLFSLLSKLYNVTGGTDGMRVVSPTFFGLAPGEQAIDLILFLACLALILVVGLLVHAYLKSPLGHALSAVHTNEVRLEYLSVPVGGVLLVAYVVSAALAGLGGAFAALTIGHVLPEMAFWTESGHLILVAALGGIGGVSGPFIGAIFLEIVHTIAASYTDAWSMIVGIALLVVIFFLPSGLYGLLNRKSKGAVA